MAALLARPLGTLALSLVLAGPMGARALPVNSGLCEECTMKLRILGAALVFALAADPTMARQASRTGQSIYCATRQAGNPFSRYCNPSAWREWRRRGNWDSRLDNACRRNPQYVPRNCPSRHAR
jgi:hypothetical protein